MPLDPARLPGGRPRQRTIPPDQRFVAGSAYDPLDDMAEHDDTEEDTEEHDDDDAG